MANCTSTIPNVSGLYFIHIGTYKDIKDTITDLSTDTIVTDNHEIYKYGKSNTIKIRFNRHQRVFGQQCQLVHYAECPSAVTYQNESVFRKATLAYKFPCKFNAMTQHELLAVVPDDLEAIKQIMDKTIATNSILISKKLSTNLAKYPCSSRNDVNSILYKIATKGISDRYVAKIFQYRFPCQWFFNPPTQKMYRMTTPDDWIEDANLYMLKSAILDDIFLEIEDYLEEYEHQLCGVYIENNYKDIKEIMNLSIASHTDNTSVNGSVPSSKQLQIRQLQEQIQSIQLQDLDDKIHRHVDRKLSKIHKTNMQYISMYASVKGIIEEIKLAYAKYDASDKIPKDNSVTVELAKVKSKIPKIPKLPEIDTVTPFITAKLVITKSILDRVASSLMYNEFKKFHNNDVSKIVSDAKVRLALLQKGAVSQRFEPGQFFVGVKFKPNSNDSSKMDAVTSFITAKLVITKVNTDRISNSIMHEEFIKFCNNDLSKISNKPNFKALLLQKGITSQHREPGNFYLGVKFKPDITDENAEAN
ncbi:Hypothetical protein MVR_LOCUS38 [uncultured virus]|nr:Hypothetical protein MVR_LOCUS38 [uncultured virus]